MGKRHGATDCADRWELEAAFLSALGTAAQPSPERLRDIESAEMAVITRRLLRLRHECGCAASAWCMTAAIALAIVLGVAHGTSDLAGLIGLAALSVVGVLAAAGLGKAVTIMIYRARWRAERDRVLFQLTNREGAGDVVVR